MVSPRWPQLSRAQHTLETGHGCFVTSLELCVDLALAKGLLYGWDPAETARVVSAWRCATCLARLDETPPAPEGDARG